MIEITDDNTKPEIPQQEKPTINECLKRLLLDDGMETIEAISITISGSSDTGDVEEILVGRCFAGPADEVDEEQLQRAATSALVDTFKAAKILSKGTAPVDAPQTLEWLLSDVAWAIMQERHPGWENGAGGNGFLKIAYDREEDRIEWSLAYEAPTYQSYRHSETIP